jgi:hypothetical protein
VPLTDSDAIAHLADRLRSIWRSPERRADARNDRDYLETTMERRILYRILLGAGLALAAGGLAAQTPATNDQYHKATPSAKSSAQEGQKSAMPGEKAANQEQKSAQKEEQAQPKKHAMTKKATTKHERTKSAHAKEAPQHMAKAKSSRHMASRHMAKAKTEEAMPTEEKAYRAALRGCVTEMNQSQREKCLDETIDRFHRNA